MNEQEKIKRRAIIISVAALILMIGIVVFIQHQQSKSPEYTKNIVDRDTGEVASIQPNKAIEGQAGGGEIVIFGASAVTSNGATQSQYVVFTKLLNDYSDKYLHGQYPSVTLIPKSIKAKYGDIHGQLRLGQGSTELNIEIKLTNLYYVQLVITDPSGHYMKYDSGIKPENIQG